EIPEDKKPAKLSKGVIAKKFWYQLPTM
ncbi:MAG: hypothetical protein UX80_C0020G0001, partial [Candidatus Amesbacteria bacterium GW2011_GWA2_47_11b]